MRAIKIHIENFKGVRHKKIIDLSRSLTILRGPNGFGKTTIFDAIELCLTGSIKRAVDKAKVTNDTRHYSDAFYRNTPNKDVVLKLLIENKNGDRRVIIKHLPFDHDGNFNGDESRSKRYKVVESLEKLPTYFVSEEEFDNEDFYNAHSPVEDPTDQIQRWIFGNNTNLDIEDIYKLFGYIQQEDNTLYLDLSETERRGELDFLYNSQDQARDIERLSKNLEQLKKAEAALKAELANLNTAQETAVKGASEYQRAFEYIDLEFDKHEPFEKDGPRTIDNSYQATIEYIQRLKNFTDVFDVEEHKKNLRKTTFNSLAKNRNFQCYFILRNLLESSRYQKITNDFAFLTLANQGYGIQYYILQNFLKQKKFEAIEKNTTSFSIAQQYIKSDLVTIEAKLEAIIKISDGELVPRVKTEQGLALLGQLRQLKRAASENASMLATLSELREKLTNIFTQLNTHQEKHDSSCPLCGHDWQEYSSLRQSINLKDQAYKKIKNTQTNAIEILTKKIEKTYIVPIEDRLKEVIEKNERNYNFFQKLRFLKGSMGVEDFNTFSTQLEAAIPEAKSRIWENIKTRDELIHDEATLKGEINSKITYDPRVIEKLSQLKGYNFDKAMTALGGSIPKELPWAEINSYEKLVNDTEKLEQAISQLAASIEVDQEKLGLSDSNFFKDIFLEKVNNIEEVKPRLDAKINYIDFKYSQKKNSLYGLLSIRYDKVKKVRGKVDTLRKSYKAVVNDYKNTMTEAVKIPFHIYSARILQNYSQGYGAFIDTPSQTTSSIRFSAGSGSDHDLVHQLSSGQLAVVSMAFSLAINKVYGNASLRFLAIDDPVHELDALNVYSLIELLRNDFANKYQLILSTHDELQADYMAYRFAMVERDVLSIKVQDIFFPTLEATSVD